MELRLSFSLPAFLARGSPAVLMRKHVWSFLVDCGSDSGFLQSLVEMGHVLSLSDWLLSSSLWCGSFLVLFSFLSRFFKKRILLAAFFPFFIGSCTTSPSLLISLTYFLGFLCWHKYLFLQLICHYRPFNLSGTPCMNPLAPPPTIHSSFFFALVRLAFLFNQGMICFPTSDPR